jgi:hypothetical protein
MTENQIPPANFRNFCGNTVDVFGKGFPNYLRVSVKTKILSRIAPAVKGIAMLFDMGEYGSIIPIGIHIGIVTGPVVRVEEPDGDPVRFLIPE